MCPVRLVYGFLSPAGKRRYVSHFPFLGKKRKKLLSNGYLNACSHTHTHAQTYTHTQICIYIYIYIHAKTHTHKRTLSLSLSSSAPLSSIYNWPHYYLMSTCEFNSIIKGSPGTLCQFISCLREK